jgi:hypothetical protein
MGSTPVALGVHLGQRPRPAIARPGLPASFEARPSGEASFEAHEPRYAATLQLERFGRTMHPVIRFRTNAAGSRCYEAPIGSHDMSRLRRASATARRVRRRDAPQGPAGHVGGGPDGAATRDRRQPCDCVLGVPGAGRGGYRRPDSVREALGLHGCGQHWQRRPKFDQRRQESPRPRGLRARHGRLSASATRYEAMLEIPDVSGCLFHALHSFRQGYRPRARSHWMELRPR